MGEKTVRLNCTRCSKEFELVEHRYKFKKSNGQTLFYCSRRCSGLANKDKMRELGGFISKKKRPPNFDPE